MFSVAKDLDICCATLIGAKGVEKVEGIHAGNSAKSSLHMQVHITNFVVVAVEEVSSKRSCRAPLLQVALLYILVPLAALAGQSTSHTAGRKVHDHQVQSGQLGFL